jgi:hypothetical protein
VAGSGARYYVLEQERTPAGRLNIVVLQQFPNNRPSGRFGYQIDCARGPAFMNTRDGTLAEMKARPAPDSQLTMGDAASAGHAIAKWLCPSS